MLKDTECVAANFGDFADQDALSSRLRTCLQDALYDPDPHILHCGLDTVPSLLFAPTIKLTSLISLPFLAYVRLKP